MSVEMNHQLCLGTPKLGGSVFVSIVWQETNEQLTLSTPPKLTHYLTLTYSPDDSFFCILYICGKSTGDTSSFSYNHCIPPPYHCKGSKEQTQASLTNDSNYLCSSERLYLYFVCICLCGVYKQHKNNYHY